MKLTISILLSFLLALFAYLKKAMTNSALFTSFIFSCIITYFGGLKCFLVLATVFLGTVIAGKIKKEKRDKINEVILKKGKKDIYQILANVLGGVIAIIIYKITNNNLFLVVYAVMMAEALSDSLASDIGVLSKTKPINIKTLKQSEPGLSGNISLLGLLASLLGALLIALIYTLNLKIVLIITFSAFLGALIDSFLGATIQVKYECSKCGLITEKEYHCNNQGLKIKGFKIINNDIVNFISNISAGLISYLLLII